MISRSGRCLIINLVDSEIIEEPRDGIVVIPSRLANGRGLVVGVASFGKSNPKAWRKIVFKGVLAICDNVFKNWKALESVEIDGACTVIGASAFEGCVKLEKVTSRGGIYRLKARCFYGCEALNEIQLLQPLEIGDSAFEGCIKLEKVNCDVALRLKTRCFCGCKALKEIRLRTLDVGDESFLGCERLSYASLDFYDSRVSFDGFSVPERDFLFMRDFANKFAIGRSAFEGCSSLEHIVIGDSLSQHEKWRKDDKWLASKPLRIKANAFCECRSLRVVELPFSLKVVDNDAFSGCSPDCVIHVHTVGEQDDCRYGDFWFTDKGAFGSITKIYHWDSYVQYGGMPDMPLFRLLKAIGINNDEFIKACKDSGSTKDALDRVVAHLKTSTKTKCDENGVKQKFDVENVILFVDYPKTGSDMISISFYVTGGMAEVLGYSNSGLAFCVVGLEDFKKLTEVGFRPFAYASFTGRFWEEEEKMEFELFSPSFTGGFGTYDRLIDFLQKRDLRTDNVVSQEHERIAE